MIVPILVNVVLFAAMGFFIVAVLNDWLSLLNYEVNISGFWSWVGSAINFIVDAARAFLWLVVGLLLLLLTATTFTSVCNLLAAPFNGLLAEKVEHRERPLSYPDLSISQLVGRTFVREWRKLFYWIKRALGILVLTLLLSIIPPLNLIATGLWLAFSAWMMTLQYIDFAADNNGLSFSDTIARMRQQRYVSLGFGATVMLLTLLPIINLIIMPIAICGATQLWVREMDKRAPSAAPGDATV